MPQNETSDPSLAAPSSAAPNAPPASALADVHGIDLSGYAALMTHLASGQPRMAVLSGAELDEQRWLEVEKMWGLRLAEAAKRGDTQTLMVFEQGVAAAQRDCQSGEPCRTLSAYAAMVAAIQGGTPPLEVCADAELKLGQFFELQQAWTRRIMSDPALGAAFRELVITASRATNA